MLNLRELVVSVVACACLLGCSGKRVLVLVPPDVDLSRYGAVGVVEFSGDDPALRASATERFREAVLEAQPGVRLVDVDAEALGAVGRLDPEVVRSLAARFGVDAVFVGAVDISEVKPRVDLSSSLLKVRASAEAHGELSARLLETGSGATVWSRSGRDKTSVAHLRARSDGSGQFGISDPGEKYAEMMRGLTAQVAGPLYPQYVRRRAEDVPPHYVVTYPDGVEVWAPPAAVTEVP
ncbi:MAG: hypothetical protein ACF8R7_10875 [Phycisphaerales bacterium JB039]